MAKRIDRQVRCGALIAAYFVAFFSLLMLSPASQAQMSADRDSGWTGRAWLGVVCRCVNSDNTTFSDPTFGTSALEMDGSSFGIGIDAERRFNKWVGFDMALGYTEVDIDFTHSVGAGTQTDSLGMIPIWFTFNAHLVHTDRVDFYLGPQIAYVYYLDDLNYTVPGVGDFNFKTDNEFPALGFNLGLDVWVTNDWAVNLNFRYIDSDADDNHNLPIDPAFVTVGVARHF
jgi:opacity protein-like surface antigen